MPQVRALASATVNAPPERVRAFLRDYRTSRPKILTQNYSNYRVEQGGDGTGTVIAYHFAAGGRERDYRLEVQDTDSALIERDSLSSFVNAWRVAPHPDGAAVTVEASWDGAGGVGGVFERLFAPLGLRRIYAQMLDRLSLALHG